MGLGGNFSWDDSDKVDGSRGDSLNVTCVPRIRCWLEVRPSEAAWCAAKYGSECPGDVQALSNRRVQGSGEGDEHRSHDEQQEIVKGHDETPHLGA